MEEIRSNDDGNMLLNLRDAVKRYHYMLSHTNLINGLIYKIIFPEGEQKKN